MYEEAGKWEHVLSEDVEIRTDEILGQLVLDFHGSSVPTPMGTLSAPDQKQLVRLVPGTMATITEVSDHSSERLRYRGHLDLYPGMTVQVQGL